MDIKGLDSVMPFQPLGYVIVGFVVAFCILCTVGPPQLDPFLILPIQTQYARVQIHLAAASSFALFVVELAVASYGRKWCTGELSRAACLC